MITVVTPAASRLLTTIERVLVELGDPPLPPEDYLNAKIADVSDAIAAYCRRDFGLTVVTETFLFGPWDYSEQIVLGRWPVAAVGSIDEAGTVLDDEDWAISNGIIQRLSSDMPICWARGKISITYTYGWVLPGEEDRDLPFDVEAAAVEQIRAELAGRSRDPLLRSQTVDGIGSQTFAVGVSGMSVSLTPSAQQKLLPYVTYRLG